MAEDIDRALRMRLQLCICRRHLSHGRHIKWTKLALDWVGKEFQCSQEDVLDLMCKHLGSGGRVSRVEEQRPQYRDQHKYHYDYVLEIEELSTYIETRIIFEDDEINVFIVNVHEARS